MDLKAYYKKIRDVEAAIDEEFPIVKSLAREVGGPGGRLTEVSRTVAARMITDGFAELATAKEGRELRARAEEARKAEQERREAERIQFAILSEEDLRSLQGSGKGSRKA